MKIFINRTKSVINHDGAMLLPGTNVIEKDLDLKHPIFSSYVDGGQIVVIDPLKASDFEKNEAISHATTRATVERLRSAFSGTKSVSRKLDKRKGELDAFDAELEKAKKDAEKEKESENNG